MSRVCKKSMPFEECELAILRMAVDTAQDKMAKRVVSSPAIKEMTVIVENFIKKRGLVPYGGIAINNILPKDDQFYNEETDIPDYDFFSPNAMEDAIRLADIYHAKGYKHVEAKAGQHFGTYKVFVQFIPVADITYIPKPLFDSLKKKAVVVNGIPYTPPNFLRMSMFLELSRPAGDTSRWEKVFKRLRLLNKHYPLKNKSCNEIEFQRPMEFSNDEATAIFEVAKQTLVNQGVVFFGGYALSHYSKYMPKSLQKKINPIADFDVLSHDPKTTAEILKERLCADNVEKVSIVRHKPIGEVIPERYEIKVGEDTICNIYPPIGCHSYNIIDLDKREVKIATIDTILSFYLAFLYGYASYGEDYIERLLCMSQFLYDVQEKNRLSQKGLLKRFSITCYGHQETLEEIRAHKNEVFEKLKGKKGTKEYDLHFLSYKPDELRGNIKQKHRRNASRRGKAKTTKKRLAKTRRSGGKTRVITTNGKKRTHKRRTFRKIR